MKLLLDMGLAQRTAAFLRDQQLQRLPDEQIVQKALAEHRIILTHDLDFSRIVALSGGQFPSVITFRLTDMRAPVVNRYLLDVLNRFAGELSDGALITA
ncbi:MAG: DUF5615 family PIN-like protein [Caldilineaceae bacterium]